MPLPELLSYVVLSVAGMELLNKEFNDLVSKYSKQLQPVAVLDLVDRDDGQGQYSQFPFTSWWSKEGLC